MAGKELRALLAAHRDRDDLAFRRAAQAIIDEEEAKRHVALARDLRSLLASGTKVSAPSRALAPAEAPRNKDTDLPLADVSRPDRQLADLVLEPGLFAAVTDLVQEVWKWPDLDAASIPRRQSVLLYGPPGCGKTSIAEAIAGELGRDLVVVRTESVVSSYLGETASNLAAIFEFARSGPYVVLFDEFDSLGKSRDDSSDHGELRRVVNAVLQLIDRFVGPSFLIAATNHEEVLDYALWRRFAEVLEVPLPDNEARLSILTRVLKGRAIKPLPLAQVAERLNGLPHAAVERVALDALRAAILDNRSKADVGDLKLAESRVKSRRWR